MTILMKIRGLQKSFGEQTILKNIDFDISNQERIGLVGYNGAGKTTLANILSGHIKADKGTVQTDRTLKIGYLLQSIEYSIHDFNSILTDDEGGKLYQLTSRLGLSKVQSWNSERLSHLSGGEKLKLALAHVWKTMPDLLILDEPTNHLDLKGISWLLEELQQYRGAVLIISHDRYFLDQSVSKILELEDGKLHTYQGNYSAYRQEKKRLYEERLHQYEVQQKQKERIESQIATLQNWSQKAHRDSTKQGSRSERRQLGFKEYHRVKAKKLDNQVKSKLKRLEQELEKNKAEKPQEAESVNFQFSSGEKRGKRIIEAKGLTKAFDGRTLFKDSHFYVKHGERIGLIGDNGCGKTTLVKMMLDAEPATAGTLWKSRSVKAAYLSQDVSDLSVDQTVAEVLNLSDRAEIANARTILANMGIKENRFHNEIGTFSLGERTRIKLAGMILKDYDLLILDEPTNHLDLPSREQLEQTLLEFQGTIIIVSHDLYFTDQLCNKLLVFENGRITRVETGLKDYRSRKKQRHAKRDEEERLRIENRMTAVLGELAGLTPQDPRYHELDQEFSELAKRKRAFLEKE
ncbi:MAG: ABC-F type ribosomal protection protein [Bacillus sp. (in: Bacteria)]|uniref:ABC transporter ATP-binding protein n=2 Tax=Bacillus subtilis group TaxID=653685 RepID=A0A7Z0WV22_9BACI|nr:MULTISPECIES: ABC-F type ribosomal protection protein [Bacillus]MBL7474930.1 ABC-F type ribosomal protection protein [Bacillus paralicheniformis]MBR8662625.1 ABC-F type ribosomal protection protein [Bacillus paralicheniformis]MBW4887908.1 ABC-F type ribosomal protection protein [Bacillus sp. (in: firmicutes)]MBX9434605.1 ABC-F type ribosomal protection protein [Bacillus paralicheniformis]MCY8151511.1 ABC-F type ribosomal protection protein [Bacillus paralicheniformis]